MTDPRSTLVDYFDLRSSSHKFDRSKLLREDDSTHMVYEAMYDYPKMPLELLFVDPFDTDFLVIVSLIGSDPHFGGSGRDYSLRRIGIQVVTCDRYNDDDTLKTSGQNAMWAVIEEVERVLDEEYYTSYRQVGTIESRVEDLGSTLLYSPIIETEFRQYASTSGGTERALRYTHVYIGHTEADNSHDLSSGIRAFTYRRIHRGVPQHTAAAKTEDAILQSHSHYEWTLELDGDCRTAFFATDVQAIALNQYALDPNGDSNKIEYFKVLARVRASDGSEKDRTWTVSGGYVLNNDKMGEPPDEVYVYRGIAEEITYSDE